MMNYTRRSLEGLWVGDCIGNLGQMYFAHDILKALEAGMAKYGGQLNQFHKQFQYSDDTEEAIVLFNHLGAAEYSAVHNQEFQEIQSKIAQERPDFNAEEIMRWTMCEYFRGKSIVNRDKLAMEFATRYMVNDCDGEIFGYGLNTRKVLRDIYEGVPWREANKIIKKSEGMPSHIDSLVDSLSCGKGFGEAHCKVGTQYYPQYDNLAVGDEKEQYEEIIKLGYKFWDLCPKELRI